MSVARFLLFALLSAAFSDLFAQCLQPELSFPSSACSNELTSFSAPREYLDYSWDFCGGELDSTPEASVFLPAAGAAFNVEIIEQGGQYYGFYTSRATRRLYRLDFGDNLNSTPTPVDLGDLGLNTIPTLGLLTIEIVKDGDAYYGFIIDFYNKLFRISFGSSLTNAPSAAELFYDGAAFANPIDLVMAQDATGKFAFVANINSDRIVRLKFGSSFGEPAGNTIVDALQTAAGASGGLAFIDECGTQYAIATSTAGALTKLTFDDGLADADPVIAPVPGLPFAPSYRGVELVFENGTYYAFAQSGSNIYRISFGTSMANLPVDADDLGGFGLLTDVFGFSMTKARSTWLILSSENVGASIYRISFPERCAGSLFSASDNEGKFIASSVPGTYNISFSGVAADGSALYTTRSFIVREDKAPVIDIASEFNCALHPVNFYSNADDDGNYNYQWTFSDGTGPYTESDASHAFSQPGEYDINLHVSNAAGCSAQDSIRVKIFELREPSFQIPSDPVCTNNTYVIENTTEDTYDGLLTYEWFLDDKPVSTDEDIDVNFSTQREDVVIRLEAAIPGCKLSNVQTIGHVYEGPAVDFMTEGWCEKDPISLVNKTVGEVKAQSWYLGKTLIGDETDETATLEAGSYEVTLQTTGTNGCLTATTKPLVIHEKPRVAFEVKPEMLCSGAEAKFSDLTVIPSEGKLTEWHWNFHDGSTSTERNPSHTFADAADTHVSLSVTSDKGCVATMEQPVTVKQSPSADFSNSLACINAPVDLEPLDDDVKSWLWKIGDRTYQNRSPVHTFRSAGEHLVRLRVISINGCESILEKSIEVPEPIQPSFFVKKNCAETQTWLTDNTESSDPVVGWSWNLGDDVAATGSKVSYTWKTSGEKEISLTVEGESGCSYSVTETIPIVEAPVAAFTMTPGIGAPPAVISFANTSEKANEFHWDFADGTTSSEASPTHLFETVGEFQVTLYARNAEGCEDHATRKLVVSDPRPDVNLLALTQRTNPDGSIAVVLTLENTGNTVIRDLPVDINISGDLKLREVIAGPVLPMSRLNLDLSYTLFRNRDLTFLCAETILENDIEPANDRSCIEFIKDVRVMPGYPNPATDKLLVEWISNEEETITVALWNPMGIVLRQNELSAQVGYNSTSIDVSGLQRGMYVLVVKGKSLSESQHIMVSH